MTEARGDFSTNQDRVGQKPVPVEDLFQECFNHYFGEREGPSRGLKDAKRRAVEQVLLSPNLDKLGIPKFHKGEPLTKAIVKSCRGVVDYLLREAPEALASWETKCSDEVQQFLDRDDLRIAVILKLVKKRLARREDSGKVA